MTKYSLKNIIKSLLLISIYIFFMIAIWLVLKHFKLDDFATLKELTNKSFSGQFIFLFLQIIQVVFLPINSLLFTIPGIIILGPIKAFILSYLGIVIGSIIIFYLGRISGTKILNLMLGEDKTKEYSKLITKGKFIFPILMLIPIFPDDILCASAGLSNMKFKDFFIYTLITRGIDLSSTCFLFNFALKNKYIFFIITFSLIIIYLTFYFLYKKSTRFKNFTTKILTKK